MGRAQGRDRPAGLASSVNLTSQPMHARRYQLVICAFRGYGSDSFKKEEQLRAP